ncbi:MAG: hypothetical protein ACRDPY_29085 [Streptosporangiaceae bacterium]
MAVANVLPSCTKATFCDGGVLALKTFCQFAVIWAAAAAVFVAAGASDAWADDAGTDDARADNLEDKLEPVHAATAATSASASAGARIIRRAKTVNPMAHLLVLAGGRLPPADG